MKKTETKKALKLLQDRIERSELASLDSGGLCLTVYWIGGGQRVFYALDEVENWLDERGGHGGRREGAGSKPKRGVAKVTLALRVTPDVKAFLSSTGNASETVEEMVRRSKAFRSQ